MSKKSLRLSVETLRTLTANDTAGVIGGRRQGIVSTDTPSGCFACPERPRPPFNPSLVGNCPPTIKGIKG